MTCPVYIGIAGWSYPDWEGIVYTDPKVDQLEYVSGYVDCIEINSSFYRPPVEKNAQSWLRQDFGTAGVLLYGQAAPELHARGQDRSGGGQAVPRRLSRRSSMPASSSTCWPSSGTISRTRRPVAQHLTNIVSHFQDAFSIVVEVRHKSWEKPESLDFLQDLGVAVANLDYPVSRQSFNLQHCTVGKDGYFRMHGRNAEKWFSKAGRDEVYNYHYDEKELAAIKERLDVLGKAFESLTVIANNHFRGAELANAIELKALVSGQKQPVPEGLLKTYPNLAKVALTNKLDPTD